MDSLKKLEELRDINNKMFNEAFGLKKQNEYLMQAKGGGYYLNGNFVYSFGGDGSDDPYSQSTWRKPEYKWLLDSKFEANYIFIKEGQIQFQGKWIEGYFKGLNFWGSNSEFLKDGIFNGGIYGAPNNNFEAHPSQFINGKYIDNKNGILGKLNYTTNISSVKAELIRVALNWNVLLTGDNGKQVFFKIIKKLDEQNTDFIFQSLADSKKVLIKWENIRNNYENNGFIRVGRPFSIMGTPYDLKKIVSISITNEELNLNIRMKNILDFSADKELKKYFKNFKFEVITKNQNDVASIKKIQDYINNGDFSDDLEDLKIYIKKGIVDGYIDDKWMFLKPVFNGVKGNKTLLDDRLIKIMENLNNIIKIITFSSIIKENISPDPDSIFISIIKKILNIDILIPKNKKMSYKQNPEEKEKIQKIGHELEKYL